MPSVQLQKNSSASFESYRWGTQESQFSSVIGFLRGTGEESPAIDTWLIAILSNPSAAAKWSIDGLTIGVFTRAIVNERFKVFSESRHRDIAKHLSLNTQLADPNNELRKLSRPKQGVCLIYPTIPTDFSEVGIVKDADITIGISLTFPKNGIRQRMNWRVKDQSKDAHAFLDGV